MSDFSISVQVKNLQIKEELEAILSSMEGFRLGLSENPWPCDLLIFEIGEDREKDFENIRSLQSAGKAGEIFLTCRLAEPDIIIQALRSGAKEFFSQPLKGEEVKDALLKLRKRLLSSKSIPQRKKGKIISLIGSKGGVGTTTVAVNLAASFREVKAAEQVALIDMNILFGEIPVFLNIESSFNWGEVAKNITRLDSTYLMSILSKHASGVYVLSSPPAINGLNAATPQVMEKLLGLMQTVFDFIVIDVGHSLDDYSLKILELSDLVLLVSELSFPCLINIKKLLSSFQGLGFPRREQIQIIMNRHHKKSILSLKDAEKSMQKEIFWLIPNDYATTMLAINQGKTLAASARESEINKNYRELAMAFLGEGPKKKDKTKFWGRN